jgi:hypothetical protein
VGILFSGGLDSTVLAFLAGQLHASRPIDLLNVAFQPQEGTRLEAARRLFVKKFYINKTIITTVNTLHLNPVFSYCPQLSLLKLFFYQIFVSFVTKKCFMWPYNDRLNVLWQKYDDRHEIG